MQFMPQMISRQADVLAPPSQREPRPFQDDITLSNLRLPGSGYIRLFIPLLTLLSLFLPFHQNLQCSDVRLSPGRFKRGR